MASLESKSTSSQDQSRKLETSNGYSHGKIGEAEPIQNELSCSEANINIVHVAENDLKLFEHQVSGHGSEEKGLMKHKNGCILKPLQAPPMGTREVSFYQQIHESRPQAQEECFMKLKQFVPRYHGVACLANNCTANTNENGVSSQNQRRYLLLDDIIEGFKLPCVADFKIGYKTWSPDASDAKIKQEMSKYIGTKLPLGMCVTGMHFYDTSTSEKCKITKDSCKSLDPSTLKLALEKFFNKNNTTMYRPLITNAIKKLREIEQVFSTQKSFKLFGSSILIAYDANFFTAENELLAENNDESAWDDASTPLRVFMIDFAHFHPSDDDSLDDNYLVGLRNFIEMLCDIIAPSKVQS